MTQEAQNKIENRHASRKQDSIYNELINKSGGFNPFLTEMNYKITFKTWLKFARKRMRMERQGADYSRRSVKETMRDSLVKFIDVEIEIQREVEYTSEEDPEVSSQMSRRFKTQKFDRSARTKTMAQDSLAEVVHTCRKQDHLVAFEKQMLTKFKSLRSLKVPGSEGKHSQAPKTPFKMDQLLYPDGTSSASQAKSHQIRASLANSLAKKFKHASKKNGSSGARKRETNIDASLRKGKSIQQQKT